MILRMKPLKRNLSDPTLDLEVQKTTSILYGELGCVMQADLPLEAFVALLEVQSNPYYPFFC